MHFRFASLPARLAALLLLAAALGGTAFAQSAESDMAQAWKDFQEKNFDDTVKVLDHVIEVYPNDSAFLAQRARVYYLRALALAQMQNWNRLPAAVDEYLDVKGDSPAAWSEELLFWKARALVNDGKFSEAQAVLDNFTKQFPNSKFGKSAQLILAMALIQGQKWAEAADQLAKMRATSSGVEWGRYLLLEAQARMNNSQYDEASKLVDEGYRNQRRLVQITAFELLAVQLAEMQMAGENKSEAIRTLLRIPPRDEILKMQDAQIVNLQKYYDTLQKQDPTGAETGMARSLLEQVKKEREQFAALPNFDSSVRFRIAKAFLDNGRFRETAFMLKGMLDQLPADAVVEQASETLAQCYTQIGRAQEVIDTVDKFAKKFPASKGMPTMLLQKCIALQNQNKIPESNAALDDFLQKYPNDPLAANAAFLRAFNSVTSQDFTDAAQRFLDVQKNYPNSPIVSNALFWQAQALSMAQQSDLALPLYEAYIQKYPDGESADEARYRHAFTLYDLRQYDKAVPELEKYVSDHPNSPDSAEGMLLLGDIYFGRREYDKAIDMLLKVPKGVGRYLEEAYFKVGKYYQKAEETEKLRTLFETFQTEFPDSPRLSEAIYQLGLTYKDEPDKQRDIFWKAFDRFGSEPSQWGVTDILQSLVKASNTRDSRAELLKRLGDIRDKASVDKDKRTLALNAAWGLAMAQRAGDDTVAANQTLIRANTLTNPAEDNPAILMDIALAFQQTGDLAQAAKIYQEVHRWNPVSAFNEAIYANLGFIALDQHNPQEARKEFDRYFNETPAMELRGNVMLKVASMELADGNREQAIKTYEKALEDKDVAREQKAGALLAIGNIYSDLKQYDKAIAYLQRIYVLYSAFPEIVAKAYLQSARAFELRGDPVAAARTYMEMLGLSDLAGEKFASYRQQAERQLRLLPIDAQKKAQAAQEQAPASASATN